MVLPVAKRIILCRNRCRLPKRSPLFPKIPMKSPCPKPSLNCDHGYHQKFTSTASQTTILMILITSRNLWSQAYNHLGISWSLMIHLDISEASTPFFCVSIAARCLVAFFQLSIVQLAA